MVGVSLLLMPGGVDHGAGIGAPRVYLRGEEWIMSAKTKKTPGWVTESISYWSERIYEGDVGVDWEDGTAENHCWRCGCKRSLQRCHIVPKSLGGSDDPSNIIPLCAMCHDDAPNVADPLEMWNWIKKSHGSLSGLFWVERAFEEADLTKEQQKIMTRKRGKFIKSLKSVFERTGTHFGQRNGGSRTTVSTLAWVIKEAIKELEGSKS